MGRPRKHNRHLPENMQHKGNSFYYVVSNRWIPLGKTYTDALIAYADLVGKRRVLTTYKDHSLACIEAKRTGAGAKKVADRTLKGYIQAHNNTVKVFGEMGLHEITAPMIFKYITIKGNVAANRDKAHISNVYTHARRTGEFLGVDPSKGLNYRNEEKPRERYVTDDELERILSVATPKMSAAIRVVYLLGCRISDALAILVSNITDETLTYWNSKSKRWVTVELSDALDAAVNDALALWDRTGRTWLFESRANSGKTRKPVTAYTYGGFRSNWLRTLEKAGLDDRVTLHDFRAKAGSDVEEDRATELLDHSNPSVTKRHYRRKKSAIKPTK